VHAQIVEHYAAAFIAHSISICCGGSENGLLEAGAE
jgi:hypothetical protein